jgi:hypothetical protein
LHSKISVWRSETSRSSGNWPKVILKLSNILESRRIWTWRELIVKQKISGKCW